MAKCPSPFGKSPEILDCCHASPQDGRSSCVSRFRDLRPPVTQILCQLETPVAEIPTVSSISATCPNEWTAVIFSGFRDFRRGVSRPSSTRPPISRTPKCRNFDGAWICCHVSFLMDGPDDFGISRIGVWSAVSFARPTPDSRFCDRVRSTTHDLSRSNGLE
jgi:hypothetical protein